MVYFYLLGIQKIGWFHGQKYKKHILCQLYWHTVAHIKIRVDDCVIVDLKKKNFDVFISSVDASDDH